MPVLFGRDFADLSRQQFAYDQMNNVNNQRAINRQIQAQQNAERLATQRAQFEAQRQDRQQRAAVAAEEAAIRNRAAEALREKEQQYKKDYLDYQKNVLKARETEKKQAKIDKAAAEQAKVAAKAAEISNQGTALASALQQIHSQRAMAESGIEDLGRRFSELRSRASIGGYTIDENGEFKQIEGFDPRRVNSDTPTLLASDLERFYTDYDKVLQAQKEADSALKATVSRASGSGFVLDPYGQFLTARDGQKFKFAAAPTQTTMSQGEIMQRFPLLFNPPPVTELRDARSQDQFTMANNYQQQLSQAKAAGIDVNAIQSAIQRQQQIPRGEESPFERYERVRAQQQGQ